MATMIDWPAGEWLMTCHNQMTFTRNDSIAIPAGKAAILSRAGEYSDVYREGDKPSLGARFLKKEDAVLYLFDLTPSAVINWGFGGVQCGNRICGINGNLRFQIVSPRKFLNEYAAQLLPLTANALADLWIDEIGKSVRKYTGELSDSGFTDAQLPAEIAKKVTENLSEAMEAKGLSLYSINIEPLFFLDSGGDNA